jgi:hypothetical protein
VHNKRTTPLRSQRYYVADGSYYKPNRKHAGLWSKYDQNWNLVMSRIPTRQLPRKTAAIAAPRAWLQWCTMLQALGLKSLCRPIK